MDPCETSFGTWCLEARSDGAFGSNSDPVPPAKRPLRGSFRDSDPLLGLDSSEEYFSNASDVNRSDLTACSELGAFDQYLALTGDADGVVYASGSSTLRCVNGVWWLAPACRLAPSECIPLLLRAEWKMLAVMVSAAKHSMPVRIGHVESWERFVHLVKNVPVLYSIGGIPIQPSSIWNLKRCFCPVLLPRHTPASRSPRLWRCPPGGGRQPEGQPEGIKSIQNASKYSLPHNLANNLGPPED